MDPTGRNPIIGVSPLSSFSQVQNAENRQFSAEGTARVGDAKMFKLTLTTGICQAKPQEELLKRKTYILNFVRLYAGEKTKK